MITAHTVKQAGMVMQRVSRWIIWHGFTLVLEKTIVNVLTKERILAVLLFRLVKARLKINLSIMIDTRMSNVLYLVGVVC